MSLTQRSLTRRSNWPVSSTIDPPVGELHRGAVEPEADVVHVDRAVVEDEPAGDVLHPQLERAAGVDPGLGARVYCQA